MIRDYVDTGQRCDRHTGEVFPVRCYECDRAVSIYAPLTKYGECTRHPGYPAPCRRCQEAADRPDGVEL